MGNTLAILLSYILNFVLILVVISLIIRIKNVERKLVNFTPTEAYAIMENMQAMVTESEQIADNLDSSIKQREAVLEDLSDLVDEKIARLNSMMNDGKAQVKKNDDNYSIDLNTKDDIKSKIISYYNGGKSETEIAKELGISVTEVRLAVSLAPKNK